MLNLLKKYPYLDNEETPSLFKRNKRDKIRTNLTGHSFDDINESDLSISTNENYEVSMDNVTLINTMKKYFKTPPNDTIAEGR